jgi:hypothetical protein
VDFLFRGQRPALEAWERRPFSSAALAGPRPGDRRDAFEREVGFEETGPPAPDGPHRRIAAALLRYDVFPPKLCSPIVRRRPLEVGDTVGLLYHAPAWVDLFFASRVVATFDGEESGIWRTGFTYRTLVGHPELGEETFVVEKTLATGRILVALRSGSRPGTWLARAAAPLLRRLQVAANEAALGHLSAISRCGATRSRNSDGAGGRPG